MTSEFELLYRASESRDARFDGRVFIAVTSTGVYCRPVCPARMPKRSNVRFYRHAALAELGGFRPCLRCRPEVSPDAPEWDIRGDLVGRALRLIADGAADRTGVGGVATRLGVSSRHLQRVFRDELGTGPGVIARSRRARLARRLIRETNLPLTEVAFTAGFGSVRTFNHTMRELYRATPSELRNRRRGSDGPLALTLRYREPLPFDALLGFLAPRAIPGVETVTESSYARSVRFGDGTAVVALAPIEPGAVRLRVTSASNGQIAAIVQGARRLLDLDADPAAIDDVLGDDPMLAPLVSAQPGLRLPGAFDGFELAVRAILGQQVSVAAATTLAGRIVQRVGHPLDEPMGPVTHHFPTPDELAAADLGEIGLTTRRMTTITVLADAVASGALSLDGSAAPADVAEQLMGLPGIGPWTAAYVAMRALRDPDAIPFGDLGLRRAVVALTGDDTPAGFRARAEAWRPWRGYAAMHLWSSLGSG